VPNWLATRRRDRQVLKAERSEPARQILTIDDFAFAMQQAMFGPSMGGLTPYAETWSKEPAERVGAHMEAYARQLYAENGLVFSLVGVRMLAFSLVRFSFQAMRNGRPGRLFGTPELAVLENPWAGGTTQDLLLRMMQDADVAGNAYVTRVGQLLVRLRPDWVRIILQRIEGPNGGFIGWRRLGYTYHDGGIDICPPDEVAVFTADEVAHFAPTPDPLATYRGMSWLQPIVNEIINDKMMSRHQTKFWENAATPNLAVSLAESVTPEDFAAFKEIMDAEHGGIDNAYKNLYLGGGADVKVVGANIQQIDFKSLRGGGETRVAAAAHVPPIIAGLSEGLSQATYSNYGQAMRRFADLTMTSLWGNAAGSLATLVRPPGTDTRLTVDTRDVAYLREDAKAAAEIMQIKASIINQHITGGFTPESSVAAVEADDRTLLEHTGLVSVQLQPPGVTADGTPIATPAGGGGGGDDDEGDSGGGGRAVIVRVGNLGPFVPIPALRIAAGAIPPRTAEPEPDVVPIDGFDRDRMRAAGHPAADEHADLVPAHTTNGAAP
jgi:phage portal protein BeeE